LPEIAISDGEPRIAGTKATVAAVVHACHEKGIDAGLAELAVPGLDRSTLEPLLTYCAEQRCKADDATCPGCRLKTERLGIGSLDDFVARYAEVRCQSSPMLLRGAGSGMLVVESLDRLAKTWAGE
jgi:tRNA/rRNA methyltransferase